MRKEIVKDSKRLNYQYSIQLKEKVNFKVIDMNSKITTTLISSQKFSL